MMHQSIALALIALPLISACSSTPATPPPHVMVVQQPCPAALPENRPPQVVTKLSNLDPSNPGAVVKTYAKALTEYRARAVALEALLETCK